jgi:hypothetical protein
MVNRKPPAKRRSPTRSQERVTKIEPARASTWWEEAIAIGKLIPEEELAKLPTDGAANLHHYLYGSPKQDPD